MTLEIDMLNEENGRLRRAIAAWKAECKRLKSLTLPAQPTQELPPLTDADRRSYQKGHDAGVAHHKQAIGERNFCQRCGKSLKGVLGQPQVHTCTPPLWGYK